MHWFGQEHWTDRQIGTFDIDDCIYSVQLQSSYWNWTLSLSKMVIVSPLGCKALDSTMAESMTSCACLPLVGQVCVMCLGAPQYKQRLLVRRFYFSSLESTSIGLDLDGNVQWVLVFPIEHHKEVSL